MQMFRQGGPREHAVAVHPLKKKNKTHTSDFAGCPTEKKNKPSSELKNPKNKKMLSFPTQ